MLLLQITLLSIFGVYAASMLFVFLAGSIGLLQVGVPVSRAYRTSFRAGVALPLRLVSRAKYWQFVYGPQFRRQG